MKQKPVFEAESCLECEYLYRDREVLRCKLFDDAIIERPEDKHCSDSIDM